MRTIETKCKVCRNKVIAEIPYPDPGEEETLQEAVDRWFPLITCNWCYDALEKRERAGSEIANICYRLSITPERSRSAEMLNRSRETLKRAGLAYAEAFAAQIRSPKIMWEEQSAVDLLMAKPESFSKILKEIREATRRLARNTNTEMDI